MDGWKNYLVKNMKDPKIGDLVRIDSGSSHNSDVKDYNPHIVFSSSEINSIP